MKDAMYSIKGYKAFRGHEGEPCAQGTLALSNKKVADWSDDAHGGPLRVHFVSPKARDDFLVFAKEYLRDKVQFDGTPYQPETMTPYALEEDAVQLMSFEHLDKVTHARAVKTKIVVKVKEGGETITYSHKLTYTAENVAKIREKYGSTLVEIINETLKMPLISAEEAQAARLKELCKTRVVFSMPKPGGTVTHLSVVGSYSALLASQIRAKYPDLVEIVNERYL